jgi:hypothetical protein
MSIPKYYLTTIDTNWADEMDIEGHVAMNQKEYDSWQKTLKKVKFPVTINIGTNEDLEISSKNEIDVREISKQDYETLKKLGLKSRGFTNCIEIEPSGSDSDEDEDEEDEDEEDEDESEEEEDEDEDDEEDDDEDEDKEEDKGE